MDSIFSEIKKIPIEHIAQKLEIVIKKKKAMCFNGHDKETPSLSFEVKKNLFICFACNVRGTNIDLVKEALRLDLKGTVEWFLANFSLSQASTQSLRKKNSSAYSIIKEKQYEVKEYYSFSNPEIYEWMIENLSEVSEAGKKFFASRNISLDTVHKLNVRSIPHNSDISAKLRRKWDLKTLESAGLFNYSNKGNPYFIWWQPCIVFPFYDLNNRVSYLKARLLDDSKFRYYNLVGVEKFIYNLSILNSLTLGDDLYILEGITDTITAIELKLNAIGILGAQSFKPDFCKLFQDFKIIVIHDNDPAGLSFAKIIQTAFQTIGKAVNVQHPPRHYKDLSHFHSSNELIFI